MFMERTAVQRRIEVPPMAARRRFGRYKDEEGKSVRQLEVEKDQRLEGVFRAWRKFTRALELAKPKEYYDKYNLAALLVEDLFCDARTVEAFSLALSSFDGDIAGYFLSALINNSEGQDFVIHTQGHETRSDLLGFKNTKDIVVRGDVGHNTGYMMESGSIKIEGNSGCALGLDMRGGIISISGDAADVGEGMVGGEIHLNGNYWMISDKLMHGRVYQKGKLIVDK
jgi:hypothetical protein